MKILIIGGGIAGLSAAITAADGGADVLLYAHNSPMNSQSVMAEGGINAALNLKGQDDSPEIHKEDTMKAGCWLADEKAVDDLTKAAPDLIRYLGNRGVVFNRDEKGNINQRAFGGQSKIRTAFAHSGIGRQIVNALTGEMRKRIASGKINIAVTKDFLTPILGKNRRVIGAVFRDTETHLPEVVVADAVIACSGGLTGIFGRATGSSLNDGNVTATLFTAGVKLANLEMIQYHPTTISTPLKQMLISESARGDGGRLFTFKDGKRWYFMDEWYPEKGSLMPRDVVSRSIYKVTHDLHLGINGGNDVGLDCTMLPEKIFTTNLLEICNKTKKFIGIDPQKEYIPVSPGIHYFMGGIYVDRYHRTSLPGLYAAGECACQYHGANRLGGNSTLGALYGGKRAALTALAESISSQNLKEFEKASNAALMYGKMQEKYRLSPDKNEILRGILSEHLSIIRDEDELKKGLDKLSVFHSEYIPDNVFMAKAILLSAIERKESRGAHIRSDYPDTKDEFQKTTVASFNNGFISISFEEIGREFK